MVHAYLSTKTEPLSQHAIAPNGTLNDSRLYKKEAEEILNHLENTAVQIVDVDHATHQVFIRVVGQWNWAVWAVLEQSLRERWPSWRIGKYSTK